MKMTDINAQAGDDADTFEWTEDPWERRAQAHVLGQLKTLQRRPLQGLVSFPDVPGAYFLFRAPLRRKGRRVRDQLAMDELYAAFASGRRAVYVGKTTTTGLRSRLAWHARSIEEAGLDVADMYVAARPCLTGAWATYLEAVALEAASVEAFPWNGSGFGSRAQGRFRRGQRPSAFDCLHEGRFWTRAGASQLDRALAALEVAASSAVTVTDELLWDPIDR